MADDIAGGEGTPPDLNALAKDHVDQIFDVKNLSRLEQVIANAIQAAISNALGAILVSAGGVGALVAKAIETGEQVAAPILAPIMATMIQSSFGIEVDQRSLARIHDASARNDLGRAMGATVLGALHNEGGEIRPDQAPAEKLIGMLAHLAIDSWAEGTIVEWIASLAGMLHELEGLTKLAPAVVQATGLDELGRIGLRPLATVTVATPLTWAAHKQYRPNLLSESDIIKSFQRGDYSAADAAEELARLGYSDRRQDMLVKSAAKRLSTDDVLNLVRARTLDRTYAIQNLRDEGWDQQTAEYAVVAAETKRFQNINDNSLPTIVRAFVNRDINESTFRSFLPAVIPDSLEQDAHLTAAQTERELNIRHLSHAEVQECVELGILTTAFYRAWLVREGYPEEEAFALELRLRLKIDKQAKLEEERARVEQEHAAAKAAAEQARQDRLAQIEADRALKREGSIADLTRAVVRGLIPVSRLEQVLLEQYDKDTVTILTELALGDRAAYLAQQEAAAAARQRAAQKQIDVGQLEAGVLESVLTVEQFRQALAQRGFDAGDIDILARTLVARKKDLDHARAQRAQAEDAAKRKSIDLNRAEQLVVRGHWSFQQYDVLLTMLGFDVAARAAMADLLHVKADDQVRAEQRRIAVAVADKNKGLALEQLRRAVVLGVRTVADYQQFLVEQNYTADAQAVLLAEVRADLAEAQAARQRRLEADARAGARELSLDRVARAARLGIVTPPAYQARLVKAGYSPDDVAIEMDLLTVEIADAAATRAKRDALALQTPDRGLSLNELARAVKVGAATIEDYRARAAALNVAPSDVELLVAVLQDELDAQADAEARHTAIDGELTARSLSLAELEKAVVAGLRSVADYQAQLLQWGYGASDAQLLTSLLADTIAAKGGPGPGG